jgi:hypothetical protein
MSSNKPTEFNGDIKYKIHSMLKPELRASVLIKAGVGDGDADCVSHKGPASFFSSLSSQVRDYDLRVWTDFPVIHAMLTKYFNGEPYDNLTTNPTTNPATNPTTNSTTNSSTPTITTASTGSLIANAFKKVKSEKETTVRDFFEATDGVNGTHAMKLKLVLDASGNWEMILHDLGLTTGPEIAAEIQKRHQQWTQHGESPTKKLIADLIDTEWGDQTMSEFTQYLRSKDNTEITAIVDSWTNQVYGKMVKAAEIGAKKFTSAKNLITFFEPLIDEDDVFNPENIQVFVNKLQNDGIKTVSLMQKLNGNDFKNYGMNRGQIIKLESALKEFEASKKTEE